jgi:type VI protein secretion system component VasF
MAPEASSGGPDSRAPANSFSAMPFPRKVTFWAFASLVVLAAVFYLWWGLSFGVWIDNGVYAVVITLLLFGLSGMWLVAPSPPVSADGSE